MADKKLIVVLGATGNQGGSVVKTFLEDSAWKIRGVTRNVSSDAARALSEKGVEMVAADANNAASLVEAFKDAYAVFSTTDGWAALKDPEFQRQAAEAGKSLLEYTYDYELRQGKNVWDAAAKAEGLQRFIFSSLSNATKWSRGKYPRVFHFDAKAHAAEYGKTEYPGLCAKTSVIQLGWYLSNWSSNPWMMPKRKEDGSVPFVIGVPSEMRFPFVAPEEDTGPFVMALMRESPGKNLIAYRGWMSMGELVEIFSRVKSVDAKCNSTTFDIAVDDEFQAGYAENMNYIREFGYEGRDDPTLIHPKDLAHQPVLGSVEEWVKTVDWSGVLGP